MRITYEFRYGPVDVKIEGEDVSNQKEALKTTLELLEGHSNLLREIESENFSNSQSNEHKGAVPVSNTNTLEDSSVSSDHNEEGDPAENDQIGKLANKCNISMNNLQATVDIDPNREEAPFILVSSDNLGDSRSERQVRGSLILLIVWHDCYGIDRAKSSDLKDALEFSDISSNKMYNMYSYSNAEAYFDRSGRGASATVALTRRGRREAYNELENIAKVD